KTSVQCSVMNANYRRFRIACDSKRYRRKEQSKDARTRSQHPDTQCTHRPRFISKHRHFIRGCLRRGFLSRKILLIARILTLVGLTAEVCMYSGPSGSYSLRRKVAFLGVPGIMVAAVLSIALHGGAYGGGPLTELLLVATPINFA